VGNLDETVFQRIAEGAEITLPNFGLETLHHVHAEDVAQVFMRAIEHRNRAIGESFHAVSAESITLAAYAKAMYRWFGKEPQIRFLPWEEWRALQNHKDYLEASYLHIARSSCYSIEKARHLIGYAPKHTILETLEESVAGMVRRGVIQL
jgi:nucleoside-diphosphate-sugar epimerase